MKPILILSTILACFLYSQFNSSYVFVNTEIDNEYLLVDSKIEIDTFITCESCHGSLDSYPTTIGLGIMDYYDASLIVHQENHPLFVDGLETFVETHDDEEASDKYVDRQEIIALLEKL